MNRITSTRLDNYSLQIARDRRGIRENRTEAIIAGITFVLAAGLPLLITGKFPPPPSHYVLLLPLIALAWNGYRIQMHRDRISDTLWLVREISRYDLEQRYNVSLPEDVTLIHGEVFMILDHYMQYEVTYIDDERGPILMLNGSELKSEFPADAS